MSGGWACLLGFVPLVLGDPGLWDAHAPLVLPVTLPRPVVVLVARPLPCTIRVSRSLMLPVPVTAKSPLICTPLQSCCQRCRYADKKTTDECQAVLASRHGASVVSAAWGCSRDHKGRHPEQDKHVMQAQAWGQVGMHLLR